MSTRVHNGTQKKEGNTPILPRCVGTTPTHLYHPIGINNDPIGYSVVATSSRRSTVCRLSGAPTFCTIFLLGASPSRQESVLSNIKKIIESSHTSHHSIHIVLLSRYVNTYDIRYHGAYVRIIAIIELSAEGVGAAWYCRLSTRKLLEQHNNAGTGKGQCGWLELCEVIPPKK